MISKLLNFISGICFASVGKGIQDRSFDALELASLAAKRAVCTMESDELRSIPAVWLQGFADRVERVVLPVGKHKDGCLPPEDLICLLYLALAKKPMRLLEIGTFTGHATRSLADNLPDTEIHTLDLPPDFDAAQDSSGLVKDDQHLIRQRCVGVDFAGTTASARITQHFADSASWDFSCVNPCDFFFIDGAHTYDYVKNDTEKCLSIASHGATLVWHDVDDRHPGVVSYLANLRKSGLDIKRFASTQLAFLQG